MADDSSSDSSSTNDTGGDNGGGGDTGLGGGAGSGSGSGDSAGLTAIATAITNSTKGMITFLGGLFGASSVTGGQSGGNPPTPAGANTGDTSDNGAGSME